MAHISQNYDNSGPQAAALFMGKCSGHGSGGGGSWHPGPGGGTISPCSCGNLSSVKQKDYATGHDTMGQWRAHPQRPYDEPIVDNVIINGKIPIVDTDLLTLHPTQSKYMATRKAGKCVVVCPTDAWWCHKYTGKDNSGGRESAAGHIRKCFASTKTVYIGGKLAGRMGDKLGDQSTTFPCRSVICGSSPDVIIGT